MPEKAKLTPKTLRSVFVAAFAAIICVTGFIAIPAGPLGVPIVLQNMMIVLSGLVLGGTQGGAAVGLYIIAGLIGLPVFAGGGSGFATLASRSGGYIIGYFVASIAAGLYLKRPSVSEKTITPRGMARVLAAAVGSMLIIYVFGVGHMVKSHGLSVIQAVVAGVLPFIPGDALKVVIAVPLALRLRPIVARYIAEDEEDNGTHESQ
jgi:biotin transport system substrate-specific component